jgi:hypothetical protein
MRYPYIGQCYSAMILFYAEGKGLVLDDALGLDGNTKVGDKVTLHGGTDITHEYLQNTYGEVQSPEHAELIIELAENAGFELMENGASNKNFFHIGERIFAMLINEPTFKGDCKQITIPLPPKADKQELSEAPPESFNCSCTIVDIEWPKIGDEVSFSDLLQHYDQYREEYCNKVSKVIARFNSSQGEFITVHREYCAVMTVRIDRVLQDGALIKPKTPEEEFAGELIEKYKHLPNHKQAFAIARDVIDNAIAKVKKA